MSAAVMFSLLGVAAAQGLSQPCPEVDLDVAADDAVRALTDDELTYARDVATNALEQVGCVLRVVDPEDLATLYQARAGAGFYADPQLEYRADLSASGVVSPGWFNDRLGPDLRRAWETATAGISGTASLTVWPIPDDGVLYVDGHGHDAQPVEVLAGHHLVQVAVGAEVAWAWTGELPTGESLALETGLPEPTRVRFLRDNKLLLGGLVAGLGVGGAWYPVLKYGDRFLLGADRSSFYDDTTAYPDPVTTVEGDWRRYQAMRAGLVVGTAAATALVATHVVLRLRARQGA